MPLAALHGAPRVPAFLPVTTQLCGRRPVHGVGAGGSARSCRNRPSALFSLPERQSQLRVRRFPGTSKARGPPLGSRGDGVPHGVCDNHCVMAHRRSAQHNTSTWASAAVEAAGSGAFRDTEGLPMLWWPAVPTAVIGVIAQLCPHGALLPVHVAAGLSLELQFLTDSTKAALMTHCRGHLGPSLYCPSDVSPKSMHGGRRFSGLCHKLRCRAEEKTPVAKKEECSGPASCR